MSHAKSGNYADLDYSGIHKFSCGTKFFVYLHDAEWYWQLQDPNSIYQDPIGPFATSADAYHDAQGY